MSNKILIVDDEPNNLHILERILEDIDIEFIRAHSGKEALAQLLKHEVFLILLDVSMPEMNGFETATLIHGNDATSGLPIIFVTALEKDQISLKLGYETGAVDYLMKPLNPEVLSSKVKVFLDLYSQKTKLKEQNAQIERQKEELQKSNELLVNFAHTAAHDLKNPIGTILTAVNLLPEDDEEYIEIRELCLRSGNRMLKLINDLLSFAKTPNQIQELKTINLNKCIKSVCDDLENRIKESNAQVLFNNLPEIKGSETQIYQIFLNLISNSLKYCPDERSPQIEFKHLNSNKKDIVIEITDNGVGFNEEEASKIFNPFVRIENNLDREGSGIGLSTVRKIIENHGGKIEALGQPNKGSKFILTFPRI